MKRMNLLRSDISSSSASAAAAASGVMGVNGRSWIMQEGAKSLANYPHLRQAQGFLWVSGTSSRRPDNTHRGAKQKPDGSWELCIEEQTRGVLENIENILKLAGANRSHLLKLTCYLSDMKHYSGFNKVYNTFFDAKSGPTRTTIAIKQLPHPNLLIEIEATAKAPQQQESSNGESVIIEDGASALAHYPHMRKLPAVNYVSGTSSRRSDNTHVGATKQPDGSFQLDIGLQTQAVLENINNILKRGGSNASAIVSNTCYLSDMKYYDEFNKAYNRFFEQALQGAPQGRLGPARTTLAVKQLPHPNLLIEIEPTAIYPSQESHGFFWSAGAKPRARYPHAVQADPLLYVSGLSSRLPDDSFRGAKKLPDGTWELSIEEQTEGVIQNLASVLALAGAKLAHLVKLTCYLTDMKHYAGFNRVYNKYFDAPTGPTRTTIAVKELPHPNILLEIQAVAVAPKNSKL